MNEETSTPYVDWEYELMGPDGPWDHGFRRRAGYPPVGEWHVEFRGRVYGDELLLAYYFPEDDEDAGEWLSAFESDSSSQVSVNIDTYLGPTDKPVVQWDGSDDPDHPGADLVGVEHLINININIGEGRAKWDKNELIITIPPEVFRKEAAPRVLGFRSGYEHIEQRILSIFKMLSPQGYADFWRAFERPVYPNDVFSFDDKCREAFWRDSLIRFDRPSDYDCLRLLDSASGEVVTYTKLTQALLSYQMDDTINQFKAPLELKTCISHLRSSLTAVDCSCEINNIRGFGYRLIPSR